MIKVGSKVKCINGRFKGEVGIVTYFDPEKHDDAFCMRVDSIPDRLNPENWMIILGDEKTIQDLKYLKAKAENDIILILKEFSRETSCRVTAVSLTTEEGFGFISQIITGVSINIEIE